MGELANDLKQAFLNIPGAAYHKIDQSVFLGYALANGIDEAESNGVCWEVCRRWVSARVKGEWVENDTIYDIFPSEDDAIRELISTHRARNTAEIEANYAIEDLSVSATVRRTYTRSCCCFLKATGLGSRNAVIDHIYNDRGAYIFTFYKRGGHALAFDTPEARKLALMDPNLGEFTMPNNHGNRTSFKTWFYDFYGRYYKADFHRGQRELTKYALA